MPSVSDNDEILTKLEPIATAIGKALDILHDALNEAKQQDASCKSWLMQSTTCLFRPCASSATARKYAAAPNTWPYMACNLARNV